MAEFTSVNACVCQERREDSSEQGRMKGGQKDRSKRKEGEGSKNFNRSSAKGGKNLPRKISVEQVHQQGRENTQRRNGSLQKEAVWFFVVAFWSCWYCWLCYCSDHYLLGPYGSIRLRGLG